MFLNNLFTITGLHTDDDNIAAEIKLDAAHKIFEGHFPGSPVTPGVVQIQIVKEILEMHLQMRLRMKTMRTCKFLQIINPMETPVIAIDIKLVRREEFLDITASLYHLESVYLKAQISYLRL